MIGAAGGHEVLASLYYGAGHVDAVELNPVTVDLVRNQFADFDGHLAQNPHVNYINADGRSYMARTAQHDDLIWYPAPDSYAATNSALSSAQRAVRELPLHHQCHRDQPPAPDRPGHLRRPVRRGRQRARPADDQVRRHRPRSPAPARGGGPAGPHHGGGDPDALPGEHPAVDHRDQPATVHERTGRRLPVIGAACAGDDDAVRAGTGGPAQSGQFGRQQLARPAGHVLSDVSLRRHADLGQRPLFLALRPVRHGHRALHEFAEQCGS